MAPIPEYFPAHDSIARYAGGDSANVLAAVASRYIGANPPQPPVYRVHSRSGFRRRSDCRYDLNLGERFPELEPGQFVYAWSMLWSEQETETPLAASCYGPLKLYINGRQAFASNLNDDVFPERRTSFRATLDKGWNHLVLEFAATATGCGGVVGTGSVKGSPLHVLVPASARQSGGEGWIYSGPQAARWPVSALPGRRGGEAAGTGAPEPGAARVAAGGLAGCGADARGAAAEAELAARCAWYPAGQWTPREMADGNLSRIFGRVPGAKALAWCKLDVRSTQGTVLRGSYRGAAPATVYVDGQPAATLEPGSGATRLPFQLGYGIHELIIEAVCGDGDGGWGFELEVLPGSPPAALTQPYPVEGMTGTWLYLGPFSAGGAPPIAELAAMDRLFGSGAEQTFWRVDQPDSWVRPYLESGMYGRWNYPLGVTLYGLLRTGAELSAPHYSEYAQRHIGQCTALHEYALWDRDQYGAPGINHQLAMMDSLDDCGSFGAAMLEAHKLSPLRGAEQAAADIATYITEVQDRLPDGALYRVRGTVDFMQDTMWCDDLYMSTPFLAKYAQLSGDSAYLEDAVSQFLLYKERLFQPELGIMHHVYDYKFDRPNGVPWGRGNGWVIFSLAELLSILPESHARRPQLLEFLRQLSKGYLRLQDEQGLWHQVLTDPESYAEASCTSMFIYAFARSVRSGWLPEPEAYVASAIQAWDALSRYCIDKQGNVYGVCRGSGYSYNPLYYKEELSWQLNDTHGIGIVLLAGIELRRMLAALGVEQTEPLRVT